MGNSHFPDAEGGLCGLQLLMENELLKAEIAGLKDGNGRAAELLAADFALLDDHAGLDTAPASPTLACSSTSPAFAPASPQPGAARLGLAD